LASITLPKKIYEEARKRGINIESLVVEFLARELGMDPRDEALLHLELAEQYMKEVPLLLEKGDTVQAGEKLYKIAEECIKAMAEFLDRPEAREARTRGRWSLSLLDSAANRLAEKIDERIYDDWDHAYFLHVEGFHEARLRREEVERRVKYVKELLGTAERVIRSFSEK